ncbi:MAG: hypothetical protein UT11_C0046G0004 [Berkelbacteria bacterium GW2011_GWA2_38_9]|uniref:Uncharacterized protein n=1 Tax=Berkelbacteria bacterium GW2011_GWA2_38_9 TaxID=1618334 RepID=A0A0G0NPL9_9BACT|nr:MAG: hypothetical protein UT11_C0046G0004 [Berkelbacteria bacterium GW2011_GWA2_38_9]
MYEVICRSLTKGSHQACTFFQVIERDPDTSSFTGLVSFPFIPSPDERMEIPCHPWRPMTIAMDSCGMTVLGTLSTDQEQWVKRLIEDALWNRDVLRIWRGVAPCESVNRLGRKA